MPLPYSLPHFLFLFLFFLPLCLATNSAAITYHGGPILTGNVNLTLIWYGQFGRVQKNTVRAFIKSLNYNAEANIQPQVSSWWKVVEGYQEAAARKSKVPITVKVTKQVTDPKCLHGKLLRKDLIGPIAQMAAASGDPNVVPVIFAAKDVRVHGLCSDKCSDHGVLGNKQPYIVVGNPEVECPGACAWPFHKADKGPLAVTLNPPNGNVGADAMVIAFAQALVATVTNPFNTAFFQQTGRDDLPIEAASACRGVFGSGAFEGYTGKVRVDPNNGGGFNAHGSKDRKFLVPSIWDPKTKSCWTLM